MIRALVCFGRLYGDFAQSRSAYCPKPGYCAGGYGHLPELAFDHAAILKDGLARLRGKGAYSTLPAMLLPKEFTLSELQAAYEGGSGRKAGYQRVSPQSG